LDDNAVINGGYVIILLLLLSFLLLLIAPVIKIVAVKSKVKNQSEEWLHVLVIKGI